MSEVMEFGETVNFVPFESESRTDRFDAKLRKGVWLGLDNRTDENLVGTKYGVDRSKTCKGLPDDEVESAQSASDDRHALGPHTEC